MWEFPDIKQNRTLYAQANSNLPIRVQTVEQLIGRSSKQQRAASCYYNRQQTRSSLAADTFTENRKSLGTKFHLNGNTMGSSNTNPGRSSILVVYKYIVLELQGAATSL
jgi:hypothetical protein